MITNTLKKAFEENTDFNVVEKLAEKTAEKLPVDYFEFYNSISSVYSSKIEGENIDFDSFYKHKFLKVPYNPDYTKRSDDLFNAYEYIKTHQLTLANVLQTHSILSTHLLPTSQRGRLRNNPMFVLNENDRIEYVACEPYQVKEELSTFFTQIKALQERTLSIKEAFFYAAQIHLVFVKIHPLQDGNGRTARLMEKWFLLEKLGDAAIAVELEKNYYKNRKAYYGNIRALGLEYETLDYSKSLNFLLMTINSLR